MTTKIEWTDCTWSPWRGCTNGKPSRRTKDWSKPVRWNRFEIAVCGDCGSQFAPTLLRSKIASTPCPSCYFPLHTRIPLHTRKLRVFPSIMDWLDDEVPIELFVDFLRLIYDTPNLDWLLLTKWPGEWIFQMARALDFIGAGEGFPKAGKPSAFGDAMVRWVQGTPPDNVWAGTSVEDQKRADERIPPLLNIPAKVRFLSLEPLLGPADLSCVGSGSPQLNSLNGGWAVPRNTGKLMAGHRGIDWLIIGGESGHGARPCNVEWIRGLVRQGRDAGVPVFVKQVGARIRWGDLGGDAGTACQSHSAGGITHPKGGNPAEWPEDLRVREFPKFVDAEKQQISQSGGHAVAHQRLSGLSAGRPAGD